MKIVSIRPTENETTDPAKAMNDWQIEVRIAQLDRKISELKWVFENKTGAPYSERLATLREYSKLSCERSRLQVEKAERIFADWKQSNPQPEPAARRWTIYRNPKQD